MGESKPHVKLGDRIRRLLEDSNISQRELARRLNVGANQVSRWILGGVAPTYTVLNDILKICRKYELAGWLLTGKPDTKSSATVSSARNNDATSTNPETDSEELENMKDLVIGLQAKIIQLKETIEERDREISELLNKKKPTSINGR